MHTFALLMSYITWQRNYYHYIKQITTNSSGDTKEKLAIIVKVSTKNNSLLASLLFIYLLQILPKTLLFGP